MERPDDFIRGHLHDFAERVENHCGVDLGADCAFPVIQKKKRSEKLAASDQDMAFYMASHPKKRTVNSIIPQRRLARVR